MSTIGTVVSSTLCLLRSSVVPTAFLFIPVAAGYRMINFDQFSEL
jgi:hypothetical protein